MRFLIVTGLGIGLISLFMVACVDPVDILNRGTVNVVVVEGTITNLVEPQVIRLNRSKADPLTGRFGSTPLTRVIVSVIVDSSQVIPFTESDSGTYEAPTDFIGKVGHTYQLQFTLQDGTQYVSSSEVMQSVPPIDQIRTQFNANSLPSNRRINGFYAAAHDFYVTTQDPVDQHNYYHWSWKLWERQEWCCTCSNSIYLIYDSTPEENLREACFDVRQGSSSNEFFTFDYPCRTPCWDIIEGYEINVFDDQLSNGGAIRDRRVAQVPFYQHSPALVELRQGSLSLSAYRYYKLFQDQTENTGGLADTPPTALIGNIRNRAKPTEPVVGYFVAEAIDAKRYWLDRKDTDTVPPGLFQALNGREPIPETPRIPFFLSGKNANRPPSALCVEGPGRTPKKPTGWQDF